MDTIGLLGTNLTAEAILALFKLVREKFAEDQIERLSKAKERYKETPVELLTSEVEVTRQELLERLSQVQTRIILEVSNQTFLEKVLPMVLDKTAEVYEAQFKQELELTRMSVAQIEATLDKYQSRMQRRAVMRVIAVTGSIVAFIILLVIAIVGPMYGVGLEYTIPTLGIPFAVVIWSTVGSLTSILYRFNTSGETEQQDVMRWLITRPLTGIVMGTVTYLIIKAGLLAIASEVSTESFGTSELMWLIAFLAGFSDRFADGLLKSLVGRFGGDKDSDLISSEEVILPSIPSYMTEVIESTFKLSRKSKRVESNTASSKSTEPESQASTAGSKSQEINEDLNVQGTTVGNDHQSQDSTLEMKDKKQLHDESENKKPVETNQND